mgnify:FL=1
MATTTTANASKQKNVPISAEIAPETRATLEAIAARKGEKLSVIIRAACREYAEKHGNI